VDVIKAWISNPTACFLVGHCQSQKHTLCTLEGLLLTGILPRSAGTRSRMSSSPLASCRRVRKGSFLYREQPSAIALMPARCGKPCVGSEQLHLPPPAHLLPGWQTNNCERVQAQLHVSAREGARWWWGVASWVAHTNQLMPPAFSFWLSLYSLLRMWCRRCSNSLAQRSRVAQTGLQYDAAASCMPSLFLGAAP
jgi:hypothetical protein